MTGMEGNDAVLTSRSGGPPGGSRAAGWRVPGSCPWPPRGRAGRAARRPWPSRRAGFRDFRITSAATLDRAGGERGEAGLIEWKHHTISPLEDSAQPRAPVSKTRFECPIREGRAPSPSAEHPVTTAESRSSRVTWADLHSVDIRVGIGLPHAHLGPRSRRLDSARATPLSSTRRTAGSFPLITYESIWIRGGSNAPGPLTPARAGRTVDRSYVPQSPGLPRARPAGSPGGARAGAPHPQVRLAEKAD